MPRLFSKQQTQPGSTIDGNRLDRLIGDLIGRFNALTQGDREHRWFERVIHSSYHASASVGNQPWNLVERQASVAEDWMTNPEKWKGYSSPGLDPNAHVAWAIASASSKVSRLRRVTVFCLQIPTYEAARWQYGAPPVPPGSAANDFVNDIAVEVLVMSPFAIEGRQESSVVLLRERFRASAHLIYPLSPLPAVPANMSPAMPAPGYSSGLCIDIETDIPIPEFGRIISGVILPDYTGTPYNTPWVAGEPWQAGGWSQSIVLQERA